MIGYELSNLLNKVHPATTVAEAVRAWNRMQPSFKDWDGMLSRIGSFAYEAMEAIERGCPKAMSYAAELRTIANEAEAKAKAEFNDYVASTFRKYENIEDDGGEHY